MLYTEVIDLGESNLSCQQPAQLPSGMETYSAACMKTKNGNPIMCGGTVNGQYSNICNEYLFESSELKVFLCYLKGPTQPMQKYQTEDIG